MIVDPQLRVSNKTISFQPTTRTYIKDQPILGYTDIVNEENQVYPFVNKEEKVPIIDNHINMIPLPRTHTMPHYFGCPCNHCRALLNVRQLYEETKLENEKAFMQIKAHNFQQKKLQLQNEVKDLLEFKNKMERMTETQKKKHKKRRKMFDERDYNLMFQLQQSQKDLNELVIGKKNQQTEKFLTDNELLNGRLNALESNQLNNQWKDHYQKIDKIHEKRTQGLENYVKNQADQHRQWLQKYNDWYQTVIDNQQEQQQQMHEMLSKAYNWNPYTQSYNQPQQQYQPQEHDFSRDSQENTDRNHVPNMRQSAGGGAQNLPESYEKISPYFNPFWNPTVPMPYPVQSPKKETFPPVIDKDNYRSQPTRQSQPVGFLNAVKGSNSKDIPPHPKYSTYWKVLNEDNSLREKAYDFDERLNYFLPPLRDEGKNTKYIYPTVLSNDALLTAKGVVPRI
ncbi:UNKNOWN [Stylonychia lemnae]|uniref:Uncharacterized protein n=1 Tax=Stylonychia lemnae TaxID=5949 RepID=A0A078BDR0_STYLE|nr:UNKNOWN [Stylonychia lemnae]|eukprot:CDW91718.1 UNKNOWN [Stylonychia lemnae]